MGIKQKSTLVSLLISTFITVHIIAQKSAVDSLTQLVQNAKNDTTKVVLLNNLSKEILSEGNIPGSLEYAEEALDLASELDYKKGKALALKRAGIAHYYQGNYKLTIDYWTKSLVNFTAINDTIGMANILNNIGAYYHEQGEKVEALNRYLESLHLSEEINNSYRIAFSLVNIGGLYIEMKEYDKALDYFAQMEVYLKDLDDPELSFHYLTGLAEVGLAKEEYDNASEYFEKTLDIEVNALFKAHNLSMLGKIAFIKGNTEKAISYLNSAIIGAKENDQKPDIAEALVEMGNVYQKSDPVKARKLYDEAELIAKEMGAMYDLRDVYFGKFHTYAEEKNYQKAYQYQSQYLNIIDSLSNVEIDTKIGNLQLNFDLEKKQDEIAILEKEAKISVLEGKRQRNMTYASIIAAVLILLMTAGLYRRYRYIHKTKKLIEAEKNRSEKLLLNILPKETAGELKQFGRVKAKKFESVTVLFTDFISFTQFSDNLSPEDLVTSVDFYFSKFDAIIEKYGLEKIKTIGDAYMCAGGLPFPSKDHVLKVLDAAFEISEFVQEAKKTDQGGITNFDIRLGINTGPVVAGVVGIKKFAYDIWGDTVNVASRMESKSEPGKINISENTYELIKDHYHCQYRGELEVKNKGLMRMYFVLNKKNAEPTDVLKGDEVVV